MSDSINRANRAIAEARQKVQNGNTRVKMATEARDRAYTAFRTSERLLHEARTRLADADNEYSEAVEQMRTALMESPVEIQGEHTK